MKSSVTVSVIAAVSSVLGGCLFPSFDEMGASGTASPPSSDRDGGTTSSSSNGGTSTTGADGGNASTPNNPSRQPDAGNGGGASKSEVACGTEKCDGAIQFCCFTNFNGATCSDFSGEVPCTGLGGGTAIFCDGPEDCTNGNVCCYSGNKASCRASCSGGKVLCHAGAANACTNGQKCTGSVSVGTVVQNTYGYCQ